ncbi:MAG: helix-turn-helix domain-containing protein [Proteobacteria bacterium]|nr:helix-turn-helix domain-containing protein [Pseudomonadota bacterium]
MNAFEKLKEERLRLGMNQEAFASLAGVSRGAQINYESGARMPDMKYLSAVAAAGADVLYILTGRHEKGVLTHREAALLNNYRNATPECQLALDEIGAALPKQDIEKGVA